MKSNLDGAGPNSRDIISRDQASLSPSYAREYALVVDRALGSEIWDMDGKRYIDFMAGVAVMNVGHRHPQVQAKVNEQIEKFWHICLSDFYYPQAVELAEKLQQISPFEKPLVYFGNTGTEAVESAIKLAMKHTKRTQFIGFIGSFHGRTLGSLSFTSSKTVQRAGYQTGVNVTHVPFPDPYRQVLASAKYEDAGDAVINYIENVLFRRVLSPGDVAAVLVEPIQGEGGYVIPAPNFFKRLREICDQHGILLIVDEIQSGIGRTGRWWAVEHESIKPDIICFAKGIASGFPIGGIIASEDVMAWEPGSHATTFGGNPIAAAAGLATLNVIEEENLLLQAESTGRAVLARLVQIQQKHETIGDIRGRGLMIGFEFVKDRDTREGFPELRNRVIQAAFEAGLLLLPCGPSAIRITPALNIPQGLLDEGLEKLEQVLDAAHVKAA